MASYEGLLREWESDWEPAGRAAGTIRSYLYVLRGLLSQHSDVLDLAAVEAVGGRGRHPEQQRFRGPVRPSCGGLARRR